MRESLGLVIKADPCAQYVGDISIAEKIAGKQITNLRAISLEELSRQIE